ncbi:MAG: hypothetical protein M1832_002193 [Thelocarpon impressellum]|nr:MAG: hypothetical protein M1832_002193 [Thelocarpon impressellum]
MPFHRTQLGIPLPSQRRPAAGPAHVQTDISAAPPPARTAASRSIFSRKTDPGTAEARAGSTRSVERSGISKTTDISVERPSALPKPSNPVPRARPGMAEQAGPDPSSRSAFGYSRPTPKPSLSSVGGSAVGGSAEVKSTRNVLRRKPSIISDHSSRTRGRSRPPAPASSQTSGRGPSEKSAISLPGGYVDPFPGALLGTALPPITASRRVVTRADVDEDRAERSTGGDRGDRDVPHQLATHDLPPPAAPPYTSAGSPSTRYTDSPGPFSRTSTPTSVSSYSPGVTSASKLAPRLRHPSPTRSRPPVTRRAGVSSGDEAPGSLDANGLPSLRESLTSSSSGSTVKPAERPERHEESARVKKRLSPPPPSPPMRKSSMKFSRSRTVRADLKTEARPTPDQPSHLPTVFPSDVQTSPARQQVPAPRVVAPRRPSRDGAPDLQSFANPPPPVIQSNLRRLPSSSHRRRGSADLSAKAAVPAKQTILSRNPSPSPSSLHVPPPALAHGLSPSNTPDLRPATDDRSPVKGTSPSRLSPARSTSRFGLFTRRAKTIPDPAMSAAPTKLSKKGPAAGTGHEGYGRHAVRGRSGSVTSATGSWPRSNSAGSAYGFAPQGPASRKGSVGSKNGQDSDGFLSDRLEPVVITGGRSGADNVGAEMVRSESTQSSVAGRPSVESDNSGSTQFSSHSGASVRSKEPSRSNQAAARILRGPMGVFAGRSSRRPSDSSEKGARDDLPTLAARRSLHRPQLLNDVAPLKIPPPLNTSATPPSSLGSHDTSLYSLAPPTDSSLRQEDVSEGREGNWLRPREAETRSKSPRRWNFLQRSQGVPQTPPEVTESQPAVARRAPSRPMAHYALAESTGQVDNDVLSELMHETGPAADREVADADEQAYASYEASPTRLERAQSTLLPDPPALPVDFVNSRPASPKVLLRAPDPPSPAPVSSEAPPPKRSRLAPVGRIPRVVSTRDRQHEAPPNVFSRAFAQAQPPRLSAVNPTFTQAESASATPPEDSASRASTYDLGTESPSMGVFGHHDRQAGQRGGTRENSAHLMTGSNSKAEFLTFPPRKDSDLSYSSSSGTATSATAHAIMLEAHPPPTEEDIWREYDDLIDDVLSPTPLKPSLPRSRAGLSASTRTQPQQRPAVRSSDALTVPPSPTTALPMTPGTRPSPHRTSSKLHLSVHSSTMPDTPMSFTDLFAGYGERNLSTVGMSDVGTNASKNPRPDLHHRESESSCISESSDEGTVSPHTTPGSSSAQEPPNGLDSEMSLRFGALMTSRWLSFGRVLFSPAHAEMSQAPSSGRQDRLLILDGLCNDDWSFYCALTYPNATVYNLSASRASGGVSPKKRESGALQSPLNHRQIYHPCIDNPFPFPKGFFSAVVFRFAVASSELAYRNAISECKRVLRPGGHLEVSVLDLDMMNMGQRARRAVMMLKVRMQVADPAVSLKPASDNIQRLLGRRGFENINRCVLGVPAAGKVAASEAGSREGSSGKNDVSLSELLLDTTRQGDERITEMVAKVGRWWYTRCYEMGSLPDGDVSRSIWNDRALLRECEKRKTGFRLLICHAQKPLAPKRRTVSV